MDTPLQGRIHRPVLAPYSSWSSIPSSRPSCINTRLSGYIYTAKIDVLSVINALVPGFTDELKYAVVSGAGAGLNVIANAPNPIGQSILKNISAKACLLCN